jgi:glycosyltransferase involved in cell wall biosynthesis
MKVIHLNFSDIQGGAARAAYRIHNALINLEVNSQMVVANKKSNDSSVESFQLRYHKGKKKIVNMILSLQRSGNPTYHSLNLFSSGISELVNKSSADIVHFHWIGNELIGIQEIGKITKPIVWTLHDMWGFCGAEHCHDLNFPWRYRDGYTEKSYSSIKFGKFDVDSWTWRRKKRYWGRLKFNLVSPSRWLANCARESVLFYDNDIMVIPNCIDIEVFKPIDKKVARKICGLPEDKLLILFGADGGTKNPLKGYRLLEKAFSYVSNNFRGEKLEGVVFGGKGMRNVSINSIPVTNFGRISDDNYLATLYSASDIFVCPSKIDNLPNTIMEAMSCGTPCIGFDTCGIPDLIDHKINGLLTKPFDIIELAKRIVWLLNNTNRLEQIGIQARKKVVSQYSYSVVAEQYYKLYKSVLNLPMRG